ncbi:MAG: NUDIX domain-containing protein [Saprospiraceae bacterium]|jgi:ADP-ribose pyrophosphatase YjhB (NUDIX family)|nr:NUDIX domain-containing protein [Saprospiraceae bacterium]
MSNPKDKLKERPKLGVGVIIQNAANEILVGKRKGNHAPFYSIPGGHLELGETFEEAAIKEVYEETGLRIKNPKVFCVTNNLRTYQNEGRHYISVCLFTNAYSGELRVMETDKCESWEWVALDKVPQPQFDASEFAIECFLKQEFYIKGQR